MCQCNPVIKLSPEAKKLVLVLKIMFFIYLVIIILKLVFGNYGDAITGIIVIILLLMTFLQCYYMLAGYLIFLLALSAFYSLVFIGQRTQNKIAGLVDIYMIRGFFIAALVTEVISFIFYIILIYYSFQAYKEFKALFMNGQSGYSKSYYS